MTLPAYCKDLFAHRKAGKPVEAIVVSIHDWHFGRWFEREPNVFRLVIPEDVPVTTVDWSPVTACDVILCGGSDEDFYAAAQLLRASMAASVWGFFGEGFALLEDWPHGSRSIATAGPFPERELMREIRAWRDVALIQGRGVYGMPLFREARVQLYGKTFGPAVEARLRAQVAA